MTYLWIALGAAMLLAMIVLVFAWKTAKKRTLSGAAERKVKESWMLILQIQDPVRKILEADKVLDLALGLLGYTGTLGEKLQKAGPRFTDLNGLWSAHKLRNTIAHEMQSHPQDHDVRRAMVSFERALKELGVK